MNLLSIRLTELLKAKKVNQSKFAEMIGVSRQAVNEWVNDRNKTMSSDILFKVADTFTVDAKWLATGKGEMSPKPHLRVVHTDGGLIEDDHELVPKLDIKLAAGSGAVAEENRIGDLAFRRNWLKNEGYQKEHSSVVEVTGDSMEPTLREGDSILINHLANKPKINTVMAVRIEDDLLVVKRLQQTTKKDWLLCSDNPIYAPIPLEDNCHIIGEVVWRGQKL